MGSPPVPPGRHAAPGGWYPDPVDPAQERYWDGWQWSRNTRINENPVPYGQQGGGRPAPQQNPQQPQNPYPQQNPYPPNAYGQNPPHAYGQNPQGQQPSGQNPNSQPPYAQNPYGQNAYGAQVTNGKPPVLTPDGVRVSGWWWRVLASIIDSLLVSVIVIIPALPIYRRLFGAVADYFQLALDAARAGQAAPATPTTTALLSTGDQVLLGFITVAVGLLYHVLFVRFKGQTPGKMAAGIRVVPLGEGLNRERLAWSKSIIRAAIWVLPGALSYLALFQILDALFPLWEPRKLAIHDLVAKTQVVRIR